MNEGIGTLKVGVHFPPEVWEKRCPSKERRSDLKMAGRKNEKLAGGDKCGDKQAKVLTSKPLR
jgi:hypothetical protein